jgi:anti-sigma B factor antagonist
MVTYNVEGDAFQLCISGELNITTLPGIRAKVDQLALDNYSTVTIDLSKVGFLDSSGMGYLVVLIKNVRARGATVNLRNPSAGVRRMLAAIRIDRYVVITDADGNQINQAEIDEMAESHEAE